MDILSIDFDIIMSPSIEIYNDRICKKYTVNKFMKDFSFCPINADLYKYDYLSSLLMRYIKEGVEVIFIESHEQIVEYITKDLNKPNIINIDHHHDIGYGLSKIDWLYVLGDNCQCGNWVKYLKDTNLINKYIWVRNNNSEMVEKAGEHYLDETYLFDKLMYLQNIEKIIICASPEWVPQEYLQLYELWKDLYNTFKE